MKQEFKDHFSDRSNDYARYRPVYPVALFAYLASITPEHMRAWDCATGTGQAALMLADYYSEVIATDASASQIENCIAKNGVRSRYCRSSRALV